MNFNNIWYFGRATCWRSYQPSSGGWLGKSQDLSFEGWSKNLPWNMWGLSCGMPGRSLGVSKGKNQEKKASFVKTDLSSVQAVWLPKWLLQCRRHRRRRFNLWVELQEEMTSHSSILAWKILQKSLVGYIVQGVTKSQTRLSTYAQDSYLQPDFLKMKGYCYILIDHWEWSKCLGRNWTTTSSMRILYAKSRESWFL